MRGNSLDEQYQCVLLAEEGMRQLVKRIPSYIMHEISLDSSMPPWVNVARRTIAMSAADKGIMIHHLFLFLSFRSDGYIHTRRTCVAAATTILRYHESNTDEDDVTVWTHSAFCVTAANVLGLELYHIDANDDRVAT